MRVRGGGIGHKVTCDWDKLLQHEGWIAWEYNLDEEMDMESKEAENEAGRGDDEGDESEKEHDDCGEVNGRDSDDENKEGAGSGEETDSEVSDGEHDLDHIIPNDGEELDDNIWAKEGYGAF